MKEIFYDCQPAPSPRRVRMLLAEKGLTPVTREVDLGQGEQFSEAFLALNPLATVPVLELPDGRTLSEVNAICLYLEDAYPEPPLIGADPATRGITWMWSQRVETNFLGAIAESFRNFSKAFPDRAMPGPFKVEQVADLVARGRSRAEQFMVYLDKELATREFVAGDAFTMADITAYIGVEFARRIKLDVPESCTALTAWHSRVAARPSASV